MICSLPTPSMPWPSISIKIRNAISFIVMRISYRPTGRIGRRRSSSRIGRRKCCCHFNYICHFVVVRKALVETAGGLRCPIRRRTGLGLFIAGRRNDKPHRPHPGDSLSLERASHIHRGPRGCEALCGGGAKSRIKGLLQSPENPSGGPSRERYGHYKPQWRIEDSPLVSIIIPSRDQPRLIRRRCHGNSREHELSKTRKSSSWTMAVRILKSSANIENGNRARRSA